MVPILLITIILNLYTAACVRVSYLDWRMLIQNGIDGAIRYLALESVRHECFRLLKHLISLAIIINIFSKHPSAAFITGGVVSIDLLIGLNSMLDLRGRRQAIHKESTKKI